MLTHFYDKYCHFHKEPCTCPESKKILLINGDKWIKLFFQVYAKEQKCSLMILDTAEQGLELLNEQDFDAIVVDQDLPGMSGLEFLVKIHENHPHATRILIVDSGETELVSLAKILGIQSFMEKSDLKLPLYLFN